MTKNKNRLRALTQDVVKIEEQIGRLQKKLRLAELAKDKEEDRLVAIMNAGLANNARPPRDTTRTGISGWIMP